MDNLLTFFTGLGFIALAGLFGKLVQFWLSRPKNHIDNMGILNTLIDQYPETDTHGITLQELTELKEREYQRSYYSLQMQNRVGAMISWLMIALVLVALTWASYVYAPGSAALHVLLIGLVVVSIGYAAYYGLGKGRSTSLFTRWLLKDSSKAETVVKTQKSPHHNS